MLKIQAEAAFYTFSRRYFGCGYCLNYTRKTGACKSQIVIFLGMRSTFSSMVRFSDGKPQNNVIYC